MERSTLGIVVFLVGILILVQSFVQQQQNVQIAYLIIGVVLVIGGLWYAAKIDLNQKIREAKNLSIK